MNMNYKIQYTIYSPRSLSRSCTGEGTHQKIEILKGFCMTFTYLGKLITSFAVKNRDKVHRENGHRL